MLEIFFAPVCVRCNKYLGSGNGEKSLVCGDCFDGIPVYKTISYSPSFTLAAVSSYENETIRELLHYFKYKRFLGAMGTIEELIAKYLGGVDIKNMIPPDAVIVPIPLHKKRLRERGFNQAEEIARILGERLNLQVRNRVLIKTLDTEHQTSLSDKDGRSKNVRGSFALSHDADVGGKTVLLVDDVYTTGATMNEAAKILRRAGVKSIIGFVIAKTA